MSTDSATLFFALLAVVAELLVLGRVVVELGRRWSEPPARAWAVLRRDLGPQAHLFAAVVALVCMLGSLYLSEVADFPPCRLCWVQRYFMYPLTVLCAAQSVRSLRRWLRPLSIAMAVIGGGVSIWHMIVERHPSLEGATCDPTNPCSIIWVERFGYLTIPTMALSGFALIVALLTVPPPEDP